MGKEYGWRYRRKGYVVGASNGDPAKFWSHDEYLRLMNVSHDQGTEMAERTKLLHRAYQGDAEALAELKARYRLRLPLVEAQLAAGSRQGAA